MFEWKELVEFWTFEDIERINDGSSKTILLQFTGLKDRNGKEVYEGDIIKLYLGAICKIDYEKGQYVFILLKNQFTQTPINELDIRNCTVIGNIYENPDLLK